MSSTLLRVNFVLFPGLRVASLLPIAVSILLLGCKTVDPKRTDFLTSYAGMHKESDHDDTIVNDQNVAKLANYDKVIIDEVRVYPPTGNDTKKITDADLKRLEETFRNALTTEFGQHFTITSTPGPDTLRLRAAVVDLQPGDPLMHALGYAPYLGAVNTAVQVATGSSTGMGGGSATGQAEFLDSVSGEQIFAGIDERGGSKLDIVEGLSKWGHVEKAFASWAKRLARVMLDANAPTAQLTQGNSTLHASAF